MMFGFRWRRCFVGDGERVFILGGEGDFVGEGILFLKGEGVGEKVMVVWI